MPHQMSLAGAISLPVFWLAGAGAAVFWVLGKPNHIILVPCYSFESLFFEKKSIILIVFFWFWKYNWTYSTAVYNANISLIVEPKSCSCICKKNLLLCFFLFTPILYCYNSSSQEQRCLWLALMLRSVSWRDRTWKSSSWSPYKDQAKLSAGAGWLSVIMLTLQICLHTGRAVHIYVP